MKQIQTEDEFVIQCGIPLDSNDAVFALKVRFLLYQYAAVKSKSKSAEQILAPDRIESDLKIHHVDSLELTDLAIELESDGVGFTEQELHEVFNLNKNDATVKEIVSKLLDSWNAKTQQADEPESDLL